MVFFPVNGKQSFLIATPKLPLISILKKQTHIISSEFLTSIWVIVLFFFSQ